MGGEVLLLACGGCFSSNLIAAAKARAVRINDPSVDVHGTAGRGCTPLRVDHA
jgi:uncharacterized OsmC-like protein